VETVTCQWVEICPARLQVIQNILGTVLCSGFAGVAREGRLEALSCTHVDKPSFQSSAQRFLISVAVPNLSRTDTIKNEDIQKGKRYGLRLSGAESIGERPLEPHHQFRKAVMPRENISSDVSGGVHAHHDRYRDTNGASLLTLPRDVRLLSIEPGNEADVNLCAPNGDIGDDKSEEYE
jgi:hypothetical protein